MTNYHINEDSFGSDCPNNWEEIADFLNDLIDRTLDQTPCAFDPGFDDTGLSADGHDIVNGIWDRFCSGDMPDAPAAVYDEEEKLWYAIMTSPEDDDWGTGTYSINMASEWLHALPNIPMLTLPLSEKVITPPVSKKSTDENYLKRKGTEMEYTYYLTQRPAGPGCQPRKGLLNIEDLDGRFVPEISREAWSMVTYDRPLTDEEIRSYELTRKEGKTA